MRIESREDAAARPTKASRRARLGFAPLGLARLGLARLGLAHLGLAHLGLALRSAAAALAILVAPTAALANICSEANVNAYLALGDRDTIVDKQRFYQSAREFFPVYAKPGGHYAGTDAILDYWNDHLELRDHRWLAYVLATAWHETAFRMAPVRETLASTDAEAVRRLEAFYERRGRSGPVYWRPDPVTGHSYFGRGYVQLTWNYNYQRADERFGITEPSESFYWNPNFVLNERKSIEITYDGMIYGWYTGRCLLQYIQENRRADYVESRRIINGKDKAAEIAAHAERFERVINASLAPAPERQTPVATIDDGASSTRSVDGAAGAASQETMARIAALEASLQEERDQMAALTTANRRLAEDFAAAQRDLSTNVEEMERTRNEIAIAQQSLDETRAALDETRTEIGGLLTQIEALRRDIDQTRQSIGAQPVNTELSSTDRERIAAMERTVADAEADRRRTTQALEGVERQVDAMARQLNDQDARFATIIRELEQAPTAAGNQSVWEYWFGSSQ